MAAVNRSIFFLNFTLNAMLFTTLAMIAVIVYWAFEPDPLRVDYLPKDNGWSECSERRYQLVRAVEADKDLVVQVKEYWWDIDGMDDIDGVLNEYPHKPITTYTLKAGTRNIFKFPKHVPADLPYGRYRYRPEATYKINPIKTIVRDLPVQYVNVKCDYDKQKHGVVE